jgi:2-hydroxychromene-2-carboxylate isomerase
VRAADALSRRLAPRAIVALSQVSWPSRLAAAARRRLGRRGRVELFFAFDDPCSAVAVIDLAERVRGRDVQLRLEPVVSRGIDGDPAAGAKRRFAMDDARRRGRRAGLELSRRDPLGPGDTAFLAEWTASAPPGPAVTAFCVAALRTLWFSTDGHVDPVAYAALWGEHVGGEPSARGGVRAAARNERRMRRRGPYDTPAAWVHGQWFFAHDRLAQIGARLDDLGWVAS